MNIAVIGTGYVGLVTGACLSDYGNTVYCVDVNEDKINELKKGIVRIFEPNLENLVKTNFKANRLKFTTQIKEALKVCNICFIAVGTPMGEDGSADLQYVLSAASSIGKYMTMHTYVIDKSTVPVGTSEKVRAIIKKELKQRKSKLTFDVISNPEFLKEGTAVFDCSRPDRIIVGCDNSDAEQLMRNLYSPFVKNTNSFIFMDIRSAEMTKYAANAMLATKISFMNEIANICVHVGANVNNVRLGIGSDKRIGFNFIYPGCGYGGSCFPKDIKALIKTSLEYDYDAKLLKDVARVNEIQKHKLVKMIVSRFGNDLRNRTFAIWGLAFKPNTDDMREAPSINVINELIKLGAKIKAYDPKAMKIAKQIYFKNNSKIKYCKTKEDTIADSDAIVLITEWKEFRMPDFNQIKAKLKYPIIFDGRNQFNEKELDDFGFEYYQIGVKR